MAINFYAAFQASYQFPMASCWVFLKLNCVHLIDSYSRSRQIRGNRKTAINTRANWVNEKSGNFILDFSVLLSSWQCHVSPVILRHSQAAKSSFCEKCAHEIWLVEHFIPFHHLEAIWLGRTMILQGKKVYSFHQSQMNKQKTTDSVKWTEREKQENQRDEKGKISRDSQKWVIHKKKSENTRKEEGTHSKRKGWATEN